jgi:SAM-dependent methyltransferase
LANRTGQVVGANGSFEAYEAVGKQLHHAVLSALPSTWSWPGKRVLDFGCGAGRTLRHFVEEAGDAEISGCDIDAVSVDWINANLNPPVRAFVNDESPPLPRPDGSFDLIYAFSVFTHLTDSWSVWLLELQRLLAPGGILIATFLGAGMAELVAGEPWVEDRIGMNVLGADRDWAHGGPTVMLSPWWIREHWGRAFEIERIDDGTIGGTQGMIVARPRSDRPRPAELERIDPNEPRELAALRHNIDQLHREVAAARADAVRDYESSRSWRLTAPLRRMRRALNRT